MVDHFRQSLGRFALSFALVFVGQALGGILAHRYGVVTNGGIVMAKVGCCLAMFVFSEAAMVAGGVLWDAARGR